MSDADRLNNLSNEMDRVQNWQKASIGALGPQPAPWSASRLVWRLRYFIIRRRAIAKANRLMNQAERIVDARHAALRKLQGDHE